MSQLCRICREKTETVAHEAGSCGLLMKRPGTVRHDKVGARIHRWIIGLNHTGLKYHIYKILQKV